LIKSHALVNEKNLVRVSIPGGRRLVLVLRSLFSLSLLGSLLVQLGPSFPYVIAAPFAVLWVAAFRLPLLPCTVLIVITAHIILPNEQVFAFDPSNILPPIVRVHYRLRCKDWPRLAHPSGGYDVEFELREVSLIFRGLRIHHLHGILILQSV
jgi:hypothetical protein